MHQAKRLRQEGDDTEMGKLVEYGMDDTKSSATTRVHIVRRGDQGTMRQEEEEIGRDCDAPDIAGKYYVNIYMEEGEGRGRRNQSQSRTGQTGAMIRRGKAHTRARQVRMR